MKAHGLARETRPNKKSKPSQNHVGAPLEMELPASMNQAETKARLRIVNAAQDDDSGGDTGEVACPVTVSCSKVSKIGKRKHRNAKLEETQEIHMPEATEVEAEGGLERMVEGEKEIKEKKKKSKKKKGDSQSEEISFIQEGFMSKGEGDQERETDGEKESKAKKKKNKKKMSRDRWGQTKIEDTDNVSDVRSSVEEEVNIVQTGIHAEGYQSQEDEYDMKKVCVGGMPYVTTEEDILSFFAECGTITELDCMTFPDTQRFKGLAFVTFKTEAAANKALALDGADMGGRFLKIERCKIKALLQKKERVVRDPPKKVEGCLSAYVGNLAWDIKEVDIKRFFKGCKIDSVRLALDKTTGEFRGYGHVDFTDDESLERGMKLDQKQLLGRPLKVAYAVPKGFGGKQREEGRANNISISKGGKTCHICGEVSHISFQCPKKPLG